MAKRLAKLVADPPAADAVATVRKVIEASGDRLKVAGDILGYADFFLAEEPVMEEAAVKQRLAKPGVKPLLEQAIAAFKGAEPFAPTELEAACKGIVERAGVKIGDLIHPIRVAITGKTVGPGLYDCLAILGREQSLARLERALPLCGS